VQERIGEEILVNAKKNEVVYLYKCRECTVTIPDKAAKFVIGMVIRRIRNCAVMQ
jgi:hypothetical protein